MGCQPRAGQIPTEDLGYAGKKGSGSPYLQRGALSHQAPLRTQRSQDQARGGVGWGGVGRSLRSLWVVKASDEHSQDQRKPCIGRAGVVGREDASPTLLA